MTFEFDIEKIVKHLERYKSHLSNFYKWNANIVRLIDLKILSGKQVEELNKLTPYQKEINLKQIIGQKLNETLKNNTSLFDELSLWIIKDWGGIKGAKDSVTIELVLC